MTLRAVLFDVDFTLARPGPELGADGYVRIARRYGMELDATRYEDARAAALASLQRHPEHVHDEEIWYAFAERIIRGMGGEGEDVRACAVEVERGWERSENFDLYEDVFPVFDELRSHGLKLGLVSNGARNLDEFVVHHRLDVDAAVGSRAHGWTKPHPSIFEAVLGRLGVDPDEAVMVGDSRDDDLAGARALGMRAFLIDREGGHAGDDVLPDLYTLPAALGLVTAAR
jgi:putative hydrolase of the HAD superfamily